MQMRRGSGSDSRLSGSSGHSGEAPVGRTVLTNRTHGESNEACVNRPRSQGARDEHHDNHRVSSRAPTRASPERRGRLRACNDLEGCVVTFTRYRTVNGQTLDAHDYGYKAWPIHSKAHSKKAA